MVIAAIIEVFATNWKHWLAAKILNVSIWQNTESVRAHIDTTSGLLGWLQPNDCHHLHL